MDNTEIVFDQQDVEKNKTTGILMAVFPVLFFLPLVSAEMKDSAFLKFRTNQTFMCVIIAAVGNIVGAILGSIPAIGGVLTFLFSIATLVVYLFNLVYAIQGVGKKIPVVGDITIFK